MDVVITYVNGADPEWQQQYAQAVGTPGIVKRYRDWGTLKYLLRAIQVNLPFVRNVYLVVSSQSQVPQWAGPELKIVLHREIIPERFLPTFNSTTIEMFLHRIPGLDEEFIYFNDDIFPILPCKPEDFFREGKAALLYRTCLFACGQFKKQTRNSYRMACRALGIRPRITFLRPQHTATTMLRSVGEELYSKMAEEIESTLSAVRSDGNVSQYLFLDYQKLSGRAVGTPLRKKHFQLAITSGKELRECILRPRHQILCINDANVPQEKFETICEALTQTLQTRFGTPSRFEKQ